MLSQASVILLGGGCACLVQGPFQGAHAGPMSLLGVGTPSPRFLPGLGVPERGKVGIDLPEGADIPEGRIYQRGLVYQRGVEVYQGVGISERGGGIPEGVN